MNPTDLTQFNHAVQLAQSGQRQLAYQELAKLANTNPREATLFLWLAYTTPDSHEAKRALIRVLEIEPNNVQATQAFMALNSQQPQMPSVGPQVMQYKNDDSKASGRWKIPLWLRIVVFIFIVGTASQMYTKNPNIPPLLILAVIIFFGWLCFKPSNK